MVICFYQSVPLRSCIEKKENLNITALEKINLIKPCLAIEHIFENKKIHSSVGLNQTSRS